MAMGDGRKARGGEGFRPRRVVWWVVRGGAGLFVVVSLAHVLLAAYHRAHSPGGVFKTYHTQTGEGAFHAWGLTYAGRAGLLLALGQAIVVGGAWMAARWGRRPVVRRAGTGLIGAWALLWSGNLWWIAWLEGGVAAASDASGAFTLAMQVLPLAALAWSAVAWRRSGG
jgi:hypothetical protein